MTLDHGVNIIFEEVHQQLPAGTPTVPGIVGTGTAGSPSATPGTPVVVNNLTQALAAFGTAGTLIDFCRIFFALSGGHVVGIRYNHALTGNDLADAITAAINALPTAVQVTHHRPTLIAAPGLTFAADDSGATNARATLLKTVAERIRAYAALDAAYPTIALAKTYATNNGGDRAVITAQQIQSPEVAALHGSSFYIAARARNDALNGVHDSLDNRVLQHIVGVTPGYSFSDQLPGFDSASLDASSITGFFQDEDGQWIAWGDRTRFTPASDPRRFVANGRIADELTGRAARIIRRTVGRGLLDVGIAATNVQHLLDTYIAEGRIRSGIAEPDPDANTEANLDAGIISIQMPVRFRRIAQVVNLRVQVQTAATA